MQGPIEHPSDELLTAYCNDEVNQTTIDEIEEHLKDCGDCCRKVVLIVRQSVSDRIN